MWMRIRGIPQDRYKSMALLLHALCWTLSLCILLIVIADEATSETPPDWYAISFSINFPHNFEPVLIYLQVLVVQ